MKNLIVHFNVERKSHISEYNEFFVGYDLVDGKYIITDRETAIQIAIAWLNTPAVKLTNPLHKEKA